MKPYLELLTVPPEWRRMDEARISRPSGYYLWNVNKTSCFGPFNTPENAQEWHDIWVNAPREFWPDLVVGFSYE